MFTSQHLIFTFEILKNPTMSPAETHTSNLAWFQKIFLVVFHSDVDSEEEGQEAVVVVLFVHFCSGPGRGGEAKLQRGMEGEQDQRRERLVFVSQDLQHHPSTSGGRLAIPKYFHLLTVHQV